MKKIFFILIPALLIALIIYLFIQHYNNLRTQKGALQVTSLPQSKVYLNNKYIGRTPIGKTDPNDLIEAGSYTIRLEPVESGLTEYQERITISPGILTVVDRKFRKGVLSEGYVITLNPLPDKTQSQLEVISFPSDSKVELDSNSIGNTPLLFKKPTESDHMLKISKDGYIEKLVRIKTLTGYRLTVIAYLSANAEVDTSDLQQINSTTQPAPSVAVITPAPVKNTIKVLILDTPTGFLRVREESNINATQITTVSPGDSFPLLSEQPGWFQILLPDGKKGWVSSQYAKKQ